MASDDLPGQTGFGRMFLEICRLWRICLLAGFACLAAGSSYADPATPDAPTYMFDVPSQPLETALHAYGAITGVEVLYESKIARDLRSTSVNGRLTAHEALVSLLGPTIAVQYTGSKAITLVLRSDPAINGGAPAPGLTLDPLDVIGGAAPEADPQELKLYGEAVQAEVEGRLRRDARTRTGDYRAEIALWIDPARTVRRAALARTTGDAARDAAIVEALNGLKVARNAPPQAAQPIRLMITVKAR